jgi:REP element-mobilizing transposase RayT
MRRKKVSDGYWHVFTRGARRLPIVQDDEDRLLFLDLLRAACEATGCVLLAFALMSNHYHLVIRASSAALSRCMRLVNGQYSRRYNLKYGLSGATFERPYQCHLQRSPFFLLRTVAYVLLNPVVAGIVSRAEEYPWSAYSAYMGGNCPVPVEVTPILSLLDPDITIARRLFAAHIDSQAQAQMKKIPASPTWLDLAAQHFGWLIRHAKSSRAGVPANLDPSFVAIYWAHQCGIPPRAIARYLGLNPKQVSNRLHSVKSLIANNSQLEEALIMP